MTNPHSDAYRDMVLDADASQHVAHIQDTLKILAGIQRRNAANVKRNRARKAGK